MWKLLERMADGYKGRRITVGRHKLTNGATEVVWDVAHVQSAVAVLPVVKEGEDTFYIFVKQHRYPIDPDGKIGAIIEACAGKIEDGQTPMDAAIAELKQETGYKSNKWTPLGEFYSSPGITDERIFSFVAEDLIPGEQELEVSERGLEVVRIPQAHAIEMVQSNTIKDQKTCALIMLHATLNMKWSMSGKPVSV